MSKHDSKPAGHPPPLTLAEGAARFVDEVAAAAERLWESTRLSAAVSNPYARHIAIAIADEIVAAQPDAVHFFGNRDLWSAGYNPILVDAIRTANDALNAKDAVALLAAMARIKAHLLEAAAGRRCPRVNSAEGRWAVIRACDPPEIEGERLSVFDAREQAEQRAAYQAKLEARSGGRKLLRFEVRGRIGQIYEFKDQEWPADAVAMAERFLELFDLSRESEREALELEISAIETNISRPFGDMLRRIARDRPGLSEGRGLASLDPRDSKPWHGPRRTGPAPTAAAVA